MNSPFVLIVLTLLAVERGSADEPGSRRPHPFGQREHVVRQLSGEQNPVTIPAELQVVSQPWQRENAQMPYLVYMPEKDRLLMLVECRQPIQTAFITSDDHGKTWSER
ncbi:MAG: sialidase family protein, partial [Planctomycetaceae bacterium]